MTAAPEETVASGALHQDEMFRFARQCQLAAGAYLPPVSSLEILVAAWQALRSRPVQCSFNSCQHVCSIIEQVSCHAFLALAESQTSAISQRTMEIVAIQALNVVVGNFQDKNLGLSFIATKVGVSVSYLSRAIHLISGDTFLTHLSGIRALAASGLLIRTSNRIGAIAHSAGYHHTGELDRDFHRWFGVSPTTFRFEARTNALPAVTPVQSHLAGS